MNSILPGDREIAAMNLPQLMTVQEVATALRISPRSVWRLLAQNKLIQPIRIGGSIRWKCSDIQRWIDAGCPPPN
jgi:excisionase family DNA binding protein